jgi:hypothetical protein
MKLNMNMTLNTNTSVPVRRFCFLVGAMLLVCGAASAQQKIELKEHPFFKRLIGEWASEGERTYGDGNVVVVKEEWKTELLGENAVVSEGRRDRGGQASRFRYTFSVTDAGNIEAAYQRDIGNENTTRYEVQAAEDGSRIEMTALGDNGAKSTITYAFKREMPTRWRARCRGRTGTGRRCIQGRRWGRGRGCEWTPASSRVRHETRA